MRTQTKQQILKSREAEQSHETFLTTRLNLNTVKAQG